MQPVGSRRAFLSDEVIISGSITAGPSPGLSPARFRPPLSCEHHGAERALPVRPDSLSAIGGESTGATVRQMHLHGPTNDAGADHA